MFRAKLKLSLEIRKWQLYWHSSRTRQDKTRQIYEFSEACPRPRPQLNIRLRPRPSADAHKACRRVRCRTSLGAEYSDQCVCLCVRLSVRVSVREHIFGTAGPIFTKFVTQIPWGRGSVLLWRRCDMICTSAFMDNVTFGHSGPYCDAWLAALRYGAKSDVYECLVVHMTTTNSLLTNLDWNT